MHLKQAIMLHKLGVITRAFVFEKPPSSGTNEHWTVKFTYATEKVDKSFSDELELYDGGLKIYSSSDAALNDLKRIGFKQIIVNFWS